MINPQPVAEKQAVVPIGSASRGWRIEIIQNATNDALRILGRLPTAAWAQAITREHLRSLELFPKTRLPSKGVVLDMEYEHLPGETYFRMRIASPSYGGRGDLCVLFAAFPHAPQDGDGEQAGKIVVIGFCWWSEKLDDVSRERAGHRYEQYVRKCR